MLIMTFGKFNSYITGLGKAENMLRTIPVLATRAIQQPIRSLKQWRKWFLVIFESLLERLLMTTVYHSANAKQFLQNFGKTKHVFAIWLRTSLYIDACVWVFSQKQNRNHVSISVFIRLSPCWLFHFVHLFWYTILIFLLFKKLRIF